MDRSAIYAFMAGERYAVVSSAAEDGLTQSALVGIAVTPNLEVVFDTVKSSRKYTNLKRHRECSLVIGLGGSGGETTVQLDGVADEPMGEDLTRYLDLYLAAWPDGQERLKWPGIAHFVVRPRWVRYSDFAQVPPVVEEFRIAE